MTPALFIWAGYIGLCQRLRFSGENQFNICAKGGVRLNSNTSQFFGNQTRQMLLNLWGTEYGIGVQSIRSTTVPGAQFS